MRTAAKVDANHAEIMEGLRKKGIAVKSTAPLGKGVPDLLASYRGVTVWFEVKQPGEKPNAAQVEFLSTWPGLAYVVESADEAHRLIVEAARPCACRSSREEAEQ